MAAEFNVELHGDREVQDALTGLAVKMQDLRPVWPYVATVFHRAMRAQFSSQGAYGGQAWAQLTPAYAAWKGKHHPGLPIGELSGALKDSLVDAFGSSDSVYEATADSLTIGTRTPYARYFDRRRTVIALTEFDKQEMLRIVQQAFATEAVKLGFKVVNR